MSLACKHCETSYVAYDGHNGFCCSGCQQVFALIQKGGMEDFYALKDRVGKPPSGYGEKAPLAWARNLQKTVEKEMSSPSATLSVQGMTCVGCAWLVEKVLHAQNGVQFVRVDLETNTVFVEWIRDEFSLQSGVSSLRQFGYVVEKLEDRSGSKMSPLLWRICLCALFTGNGLLLSSLLMLGIDLSAYADLLYLLESLMGGLTVMVGASFFVLPTYQSLRVRRLHYDGQAALGILLCYLGSGLGWMDLRIAEASVVVTGLLFARWIHRRQWRQRDLTVDLVDLRLLSALQIYGLAVVVVAVVLGVVGMWSTAVCILIASSLFPLAHSVSYRPSRFFVLVCFLVGGIGVIAAGFLSSIFFSAAYVLVAGMICNFLFFRFSLFCSKPLP